MATVASTLFRLDRGYVAVEGPEAAEFLERMLSNEVLSLEEGGARQALLLTPKGRIVAPLRVVRESEEPVPADHGGRAGRAGRRRAAPRPVRGEVRDRGQAFSRLPPARPGRGHPERRLRRRGLRVLGQGRPRGRRLQGARADADRGRHTGLGQGARRLGSAGRGRARGDAHLVHEGLLPRPGAGRAPAPPRPPESRSPRARPGEREARGRAVYEGKVVGRVTSAVPGRALAYVRRGDVAE